MEYNEFMMRRWRLDEHEEDDSHFRLGELREVFDLPANLPEHLVEKIIWMHLASQPLRRLFELTLVSKPFQKFLTDSDMFKLYPNHEACVLEESCQQKLGCRHRGGGCVCWGTTDVLQKRVMPFPIPSRLALTGPPLCRDPAEDPPCMGSTWGPLDGWTVSSGRGGESGLIYLLKERASASSSNNNRTETSASGIEWFVLNPVTKSLRQLPLDYLGNAPRTHIYSSVDRVSSGYLSWAGDGVGETLEEMYPLLLDSRSNAWRQIGSGFTTRGQIRMDKAVHNGVVYLRYEKQEFKDLLVMYDMVQGSVREAVTVGLPDNICEEHLFQHEGHVYLATGGIGSSRAGKNVVIYELKSSELNWIPTSTMSSELVMELTKFHPALSQLKFFHIDRELVVARAVTERRTDGSRIFLWNEMRSRRRPCCAIAAFDLITGSWRKDGSGRFGPGFDFRNTCTTVFSPRLNIEA